MTTFKRLQKLAGIISEDLKNNQEVIDWLGKEGGLTPGMSSLEGMKAHLLTAITSEIPEIYDQIEELPEDIQDFVLAASIDTLNIQQLITLRLVSQQGIPMEDLPPAIQKYSIDDTWFELDPEEGRKVEDILIRAVKYYKEEDFTESSLSPWVRQLYSNVVKQWINRSK